MYKVLLGGVGMSRLHYFGLQDEYNVIVIDLLGPSLANLHFACDNKFSLKTTLMLAE